MEGVMSDPIQQAVNILVERFNAEKREFRQEITLVIDADAIINALQTLHDETKFNMLVDVRAVDYLTTEPRFNVVYQLYSMETKARLTLRVPISGVNPHVDTCTSIFPGANWYEREVMDMFGIRFENHPDPRRIIMPADWQGHPLRKDYPLGYEEVQFTFNYDEINLSKPKGKEF
jgi:NADH-quinone oxidoreductase subunit C